MNTLPPLSPEEQEVADKVDRDYPAIKNAKTPFQRRLAAMPILKKLREQVAEKDKEIAQKRALLSFAEPYLAGSDIYKEWKFVEPKLEKNDCSRLHQLIASLKLQYKHMPEVVSGGNPKDFPWEEVKPFVVQHDWAAAFKNAGDYAEGAFNLPYEKCAFEFRISGRSVTVLAMQEDEQPITYQPYYQMKEYWYSEHNNEDREHPRAYEFALSQIKAICVALDAEVASRSVVRSTESVNRKRVQEGREPFYSYHVINLSRRYRISNPSGGGGMVQGKKRLHFRRGHYRHYSTFKTWVRWCLVGNPELGFIDKEYRL